MSESKEFPWTYDQYQRYAVLKEFLKIFYLSRDLSILDVGGVSPGRGGISSWLPVRRVFKNAFVVDTVYCRREGYIQGDGRSLPFKKDSFVVCSALDVIEHLPREERERFLNELIRVSQSSVIVSAPFKDENIEKVESALLEQLGTVYGTEHQQLCEHQHFELPEKSDIFRTLKKHMRSGADFSYGSLKKWFFLQSIKNCFMNKKNSRDIHQYLEKWMADHNFGPEFDPPFSRHFWIFSNDINQKDLDAGVETLKNNLERDTTVEFSMSELFRLNREIIDFFTKEVISVLVVSRGKKDNLSDCLAHLLTQKIHLDLEVGVWNIHGDPDIQSMMDREFPAVRCFSSQKRDSFPNTLLGIAGHLKGDHMLLLSEDILCPPDSVLSLFEELKKAPLSDFLSPRIIIKKHAYGVWRGRRFPFLKLISGRFSNIFWRFKKPQSNWIYSECMFFKKEALYKRKLRSGTLKKRKIFLWEKTKSGKDLCYHSDLYVYKKR